MVGLGIFCSLLAAAQEKMPVKFGKVSAEDFILPPSQVVDSNTNAVIIADYGITAFKGNNDGWVSYVFKRKTRIKILNKKGFDLATVSISLYTDGDSREQLEDVTATTYNAENGIVVPAKLEKKDLFSSRIDKNHIEQKFTMPGVKENSVIEYSYTIISDFYFNIPSWQFQNIEYPCLWSEYEVTIPSLVGYVFNKRGVHPFYIDKADDGHENYLIRPKSTDLLASSATRDNSLSINANTVKHRWVMKDVPAFYVENYLTTARNYMDEIDFQLARTYDGQNTREIKNTWSKVTQDLLKQKEFALFMTDNTETDWLDKPLETITGGSREVLETAKTIYYYLSDNFTCTSHHANHIKTTLRDVYKEQKGNVCEINLLLTAMLLRSNISAAPVLLSTRQSGYNYAAYPILARLDYVVCKATIDGREYYLDASQPQLGFGHLSPDCYNGHARIISNEDSASVYFMADSVREEHITYVAIAGDEKNTGHLVGTYSSLLGNIASYQLRNSIAAEGEKEYLNKFRGPLTDEMEITGSWIDSLKKREQRAAIHIDFTLGSFASGDIVYFNPVLWSGYKSNPFTAATRKYPVEMPYPVNETYILNMETPEGYVIEELPKSTRVTFNGQEGYFEYLVQKNENSLQLRSTVVLKKANFDPEDYESLRAFFGFIVKKQAEQIVFKKKK